MTEVLTEEQLEVLNEHKYSAQGSSISEVVMQKFWRWLVEQVPLWVSPNAITLVGLIINVATSLVLVYYSPDAKHAIPAGALLLCALGLFIYQSLDAIDGKQARRTNSSSPLGELFDHGCDSISTVFVMLATALTMQTGTNPDWLFLQCFAATFFFYAAHWQTYVTGTMRFGRIDVTEAQIVMIAVYITTSVVGHDIWAFQVPLIGYELKHLMIISSIAVTTLSMSESFSIILLEGGAGKNGSTIAGTSVLSPVIPIGTILVMAYTIYKKSATHIFENHPCLYIIAFGLAGAKVTNKLVVAHMTKSAMSMLDSSMIGPGMLFLNQYFNTILDEYLVLWLCLLWTLVDLCRYSVFVCVQICDYMDIYCFKITSLEKEKNGRGTLSSRPVTRSQGRKKKVN
ncbi:choline/ethanolaminephosphotransferase 1-like isoform X2 [Lingula anatina]|uniref:diacylglycerol cholinephosphotransferase n=1 Tax=Lingula anatina TaxID=7574 RepID=A0A1S3IEX0_LINAN|nr:choline/ethanolaminephosphotransferase 1-like isoform X1 [Lingula anatina]XP_013396688.1 choline/ethanolaminephosphotransferase 1-like isoform X2 [Lingula anatina]|eukprot:XP_013396687.1 choline/ethanolaminephosphotransferase 1-like isoform X1 [Lingula anatina]